MEGTNVKHAKNHFLYIGMRKVRDRMTILQDLQTLPTKIADGFTSFGSTIVNAGENTVGNIRDLGASAVSNTADFASDVGSRIKKLGEGGLDLAGDVKDKLVEGGAYMVDHGIPFLQSLAESSKAAVKGAFWLLVCIGIILFLAILTKVASLIMKSPGLQKGLPGSIVWTIMIVLLVSIVYVVNRMRTVVSSIA